MAAPETQTPIPVFDVQLEETHVEAVAATLRSGWLTMGPRIQEFEAEFAEHLGAPHAIAVTSCTSALHLAYLAAGIGPGDEVIVPGITFVASAAAVRYCGGTPVLAEVAGQHDLGLDPEDVAAKIGPQTKAVCAVHYGGYAAPLEPLRQLCDEHGLALIEDAAHSPEAVARSARTGNSARSAWPAPSASSPTRSSPAARAVCWRPRRRGRRVGAQPPLARDDLRDLGPPPRPRDGLRRDRASATTTASTSRGRRCSRPGSPTWRRTSPQRRALTHRYRELLGELEGLVLPYRTSRWTSAPAT